MECSLLSTAFFLVLGLPRVDVEQQVSVLHLFSLSRFYNKRVGQKTSRVSRKVVGTWPARGGDFFRCAMVLPALGRTGAHCQAGWPQGNYIKAPLLAYRRFGASSLGNRVFVVWAGGGGADSGGPLLTTSCTLEGQQR